MDEEITQPVSMPARFAVSTAPVLLGPTPSPASNHTSNSGVVRVSWRDERRSPAKKDIEDYLLNVFLLRPASTKVEMRLSRRSAFVFCDSEEGARNKLAG